MTSKAEAVQRVPGAVDKLKWGLQVVGPLNTARRLVHSARILATRPATAVVRLRSGPILDPEFDFPRQVAGSIWCILDIGAAFCQSPRFATCMPEAAGYAFELRSANVTTLGRNTMRNRASERLQVHRIPRSDRCETMLFATTPRTRMSHLAPTGSGDSEPINVETLELTLDAPHLAHLHELDVNVNGFELAVLRGAPPRLAPGKIDILITRLLASLAIYQNIAGLGYRFFYRPAMRRHYEVTRFDHDSALGHRPPPPRHIIAIRAAALYSLIRDRVKVWTAGRAFAVSGSTDLIPSEAGN